MNGTFTPNETRADLVNEAARLHALGCIETEAVTEAAKAIRARDYWNGLKRSARYALLADVRAQAEQNGDKYRAEEFALFEAATAPEPVDEPAQEKRGPGAPRKLDKAKAATYILTEGVIKALEEAAKARGISRSELVRLAIERELRDGGRDE